MSNRAAVVIGCSRYSEPALHDLKYAHEDAIRFADVCATSLDVPSENIHLLQDSADDPRHRPTRDNLLRTLTEVVERQVSSPEALFFFFSGHGFRSPIDGADYFLTADSIGNLLEDTSIKFELIARILRDSGAKYSLLFLDACRNTVSSSKSFAGASRPDATDLTLPGFISFCSCEPDAVSFEADELGGGIFTAAILEALSESGRCITVEDLDTYLVTAVPRLSRKTGRPIQHPHTRVEPLQAKRLELVSPSIRNMWTGAVVVGSEYRRNSGRAIGMGSATAYLAMDFGTSVSLASIVTPDGQRDRVTDSGNRALFPSSISFDSNLNYVVGADAQLAVSQGAPQSFRNLKRSIGKSVTMRLGDQVASAEFLSSLIVRSIYQSTLEACRCLIKGCIVSYPASYGFRQVDALRTVFAMAGIPVARMISEPAVAALIVTRERTDDLTLLVLDLGGGTLDIAIAESGDGVCEIKTVAGDADLGGADYDETIVGIVKSKLRESDVDLVFTDSTRLNQLRHEAERTKKVLSERDAADFLIPSIERDGNLDDALLSVSRQEFRAACKHLDSRVETLIHTVLRDARVEAKDITLVLLSGQGSKILTIPEIVARVLPGVEIDTRYQESGVIEGLANQAAVFQGAVKDALLIDLSNRGIGLYVEVLDVVEESASADTLICARSVDFAHFTVNIIDEMTTIPTRRSVMLQYVGSPNDPIIEIMMVERSKNGYDNELIGSCDIGAASDITDIEATVDFDANGVAQLSVRQWPRSTATLSDRHGTDCGTFRLNHLESLQMSEKRLEVDLVRKSPEAARARMATVDPQSLATRLKQMQEGGYRLGEARLAAWNGDPDRGIAILVNVATVDRLGDWQSAALLSELFAECLQLITDTASRDQAAHHLAPVLKHLLRPRSRVMEGRTFLDNSGLDTCLELLEMVDSEEMRSIVTDLRRGRA